MRWVDRLVHQCVSYDQLDGGVVEWNFMADGVQLAGGCVIF